MSRDVTGPDEPIITSALAFAYAAMRFLPVQRRSVSNREAIRSSLFAGLGHEQAERSIGQAMLTAWHLTHDIGVSGLTVAAAEDDLRRIREQVMQEPPDLDTLLLVRHVDKLLGAGQTALHAEMTTLRADLTKQGAGIMSRLDGHGDRLTEIRDEITVALGMSDHGRLLNEHTRSEQQSLSAQLSALTRLVRTLSARMAAIEAKAAEDGEPGL